MNYNYVDYGICIDTDMVSSMFIDVYVNMEDSDWFKEFAYGLSLPQDRYIRAIYREVSEDEFNDWLTEMQNEYPNPKNLPIFEAVRDVAEIICLAKSNGCIKHNDTTTFITLNCLTKEYSIDVI